MNKSLQILLQLEGLVLMRKGLELAAQNGGKPDLDDLDKEILKLRRQLAPSVVSLYDRLARRYADPVSLLTEGVCESCRQRVSKPIVVLNHCSHKIFQCEHCGRLVFPRQHAPDYVT